MKAAESFHFMPENVQIYAFKHIFLIPKKCTEYLKILPRYSTDRFRKLASKGYNHQQETYSRPILHRSFNVYFHVQNRTLKYQIPPISF